MASSNTSRELEAIDRFWSSFIDRMNDHPTHQGACFKGEMTGDDEGLLWHFTRLSVLEKMLDGRQVWLSELMFCNDADEVSYGLRLVNDQIPAMEGRWNSEFRTIVQQCAERASRRFETSHHIYALSLSEERDTVQHWGAYGGGLQQTPDQKDPFVAIGFDAESFAWPINFSDDDAPMYLFEVATAEANAELRGWYWIDRVTSALKALDSDGDDPGSQRYARVYDATERMLVFTCALIKHPAWRSELEHRLILVDQKFGETHRFAKQRPDGRGCYVPLIWTDDQMPIRQVVTHPLAQGDPVINAIRKRKLERQIEVIASGLRPRPNDPS